MKASTLFALTIAALLGLGVAVGAKMLGFFSSKEPAFEKTDEPPKVLVSNINLYEGKAIDPSWLRVRSMTRSEYAQYKQSPEKYLPPVTGAAAMRKPLRNIEADLPILRSDLEDLAFPEGMPLRLQAGMRALNLDLPKIRAAGGLIARGEFVDVLLTSTICSDPDCKNSVTQAAFIARNLRIIAKRNVLFDVLQPLPEGIPVSFTLEANPYRAALIEFASTRGLITLVPVPASSAPMKPVAGAEGGRVTFAVLDSPEYRDEDQRVDSILRGEASVGDADLERIFRLKPIVRTPPPPPPLSIQHISGVTPRGEVHFDPQTGATVNVIDYGRPNPAQNARQQQPPADPINIQGQSRLGYHFRLPSTTPSGPTKDCPTCGKK